MNAAPAWAWVVFGAIILSCVAVDLGIFNRKAHVVSLREALAWVGVWTTLALIFNVGVYFWFGKDRGLQFFTGYIIEQALSVDNIFVFIVIFTHFAVPKEYQHRVLLWGVLGALALRALFIFAGAALLHAFHWMIFVFGAFLVITGGRILFGKEAEEADPTKGRLVRLFRRFMPMTSGYEGSSFMVRRDGRLLATPMLLVLVVVEGTDVIFALDSIPAIFGVTTDTFIVYTSNIFAILGLRNLYFVLADFMDRFHYLKHGLGLVLLFIGGKMVASDIVEVPIGASLAVVALLLVGSVLLSLWRTRRISRKGAT
jgi:tellurite resistance protein TerC